MNNVAVSKWTDPYENTLPQYATGRRVTGKRVIKRITADGEQSSDSEDDEDDEGGQEKYGRAKILNPFKEPQQDPSEPRPDTASIVVVESSFAEEVVCLPEAPEPPECSTEIPKNIADALADKALVEIPGAPVPDVKSVAPIPEDTKPTSVKSGKNDSEPVGTAENKVSVEQEVTVMREEDLEGDDFVIVDEGKKEKKKKKHKHDDAAGPIKDALQPVNEPVVMSGGDTALEQTPGAGKAENGIAEQDVPKVAIVEEAEKTTKTLPETTKSAVPPPPPLPQSSLVSHEKRPRSSRQRKSSHGTAGWTRPSRKRRDSELSTTERPRSSRKDTSSRKDSVVEESKERSKRRSRERTLANDVKPTETVRKGSEKLFIIDDGKEKGCRKSSGNSRVHRHHRSHGSDSHDNEDRKAHRPRQRNRVIAESTGGSFFGLLKRALTG
ncbi:hypothetical protein MBLNU457_1582t1 [Dothideomycetes sp. NU457]